MQLGVIRFAMLATIILYYHHIVQLLGTLFIKAICVVAETFEIGHILKLIEL